MTTTRRLARLMTLLLGVLLFATAGGPARAQSISLIAGNSLTLGSLVFTVSSCTIADGVTRAANCSGSEVLAQDPNYSGPGIGVVIESASGPTTPLLSATGCSGGTCPSGVYDLGLTLEVAASSNTVSMSEISQGITGYSGTGTTNEQQVSVGETVKNASSITVATLQSDLSSPSNSQVFTPQICMTSPACLYLVKDITLHPAAEANGVGLGVYTVSQALIPAPEPSSVAMFLVGLVVLGFVRYRRSIQDSI